MICLKFDRTAEVLNRPIEITLAEICTAATTVSLRQPGIEPDCLRVVIDCMLKVCAVFLVVSNSKVKLPICVSVEILLTNESVKVIIDGFGAYIVAMTQVFQYRLFQFLGNAYYPIRFNKPLRRNHKDTLLNDGAVSAITRLSNVRSHRCCPLQQNDSAVFERKAVTSKEKGCQIVAGEVDEVSFPSIML